MQELENQKSGVNVSLKVKELKKLTKPELIAVSKVISNVTVNSKTTKAQIINQIINQNNSDDLLISIIIFNKSDGSIEVHEKKIKNNISSENLDKYLYFSTPNTNHTLYTDYEKKLFEIIEEDLKNLYNQENIDIIIIINNKLWFSYISNKNSIKKILSEYFEDVNHNNITFYNNRSNNR